MHPHHLHLPAHDLTLETIGVSTQIRCGQPGSIRAVSRHEQRLWHPSINLHLDPAAVAREGSHHRSSGEFADAGPSNTKMERDGTLGAEGTCGGGLSGCSCRSKRAWSLRSGLSGGGRSCPPDWRGYGWGGGLGNRPHCRRRGRTVWRGGGGSGRRCARCRGGRGGRGGRGNGGARHPDLAAYARPTALALKHSQARSGAEAAKNATLKRRRFSNAEVLSAANGCRKRIPSPAKARVVHPGRDYNGGKAIARVPSGPRGAGA